MTAATLLRASLEGGAFVVLVALVTRAVRLPAAARCALWWLASARLLLGLVALPAIAVPAPAPVAALARAAWPPASASPVRARATELDAPAPGVPRLADAAAAPPHAARPVPWGAVALACWLVGALATVLVHLRDLRRLSRTWRDAAAVRSPQVHAWLAGWLGVTRAAQVDVRAHAAVDAPLILAGARPRILLPAACLGLDAARLRMALAHEAAHVRRRDLAWGLVPAAAHAAFWFHPLARWCVAEYVQSREEACDADALALSRGEPDRYGALLVEFGVHRSRAPYAAASCGSHHVRQLTRRIHMLAFASRPTRGRRVAAASLTCAVALLAAASGFVRAAVVDDPPAVAPVAPVAPAAAVPPTPATAPTPLAARVPHTRSRGTSSGFSYTTGDDGDASFGFTDGKGNTTMNGNWSDHDDWLERLQHGHEAFAWFRVDGETYVAAEAATLDRVRELMRPSIELGEQQGRLGDRQAELGERQSALGDQQHELGERMSDLSSRLQDVELRLADERGSRNRAQAERERDEIQAKMREASRLMSELGRRQGELGERQGALGEKQGELGRQQEQASRAQRREARRLFDELLRDGRLKRFED